MRRESRRCELTVHVAVVEDNPSYRSSLETFLRHAPGFALAGSYGSAEAAVQAALSAAQQEESGRWDLVLMDIELPGMSGIEATRRIKAALKVPVVVLTVFEEPGVILEAISAGADGYLLKKASSRDLLAGIRSVLSGGAPLTAGVAASVLQLLRGRGAGDPGPAPGRLELTEREQDVLRGLTRGRSYAETAKDLDISLDTVRSHVRAIYRKLQVHSVAEAVTRAVRERLV